MRVIFITQLASASDQGCNRCEATENQPADAERSCEEAYGWEGSTIHEPQWNNMKKLRTSHKCAMWGIRSIVYSLSLYFEQLGYRWMGSLQLPYNFIK